MPRNEYPGAWEVWRVGLAGPTFVKSFGTDRKARAFLEDCRADAQRFYPNATFEFQLVRVERFRVEL